MRLSDRQILVTGANGFIGGHLVRRLADQEQATVRAMLRRPDRTPPDLSARPRVECTFGEITDWEATFKAAAGCDIVIHTAALQPLAPQPARAEFNAVNVGGTLQLARAAKKAGVSRFLLLSTINVHGLPPPPGAGADSLLRHSGDRYSDSKVDGERAAWTFAREHGLPLTVVRPACTYGPGSKPWVLQPLERIRRGLPVLIGDGRGFCNPVYVDNLIDLIVAALLTDAGVGEAFIGSDGTGLKWREFFGHFARLCGKPLRSIPGPVARGLAFGSTLLERTTGRTGPLSRTSLAFYTHRTVFDTQKNLRLLGHTPRITFEEGMLRTEKWLRAQRFL